MDVLAVTETLHMPRQGYMSAVERAYLAVPHRERLVVWMKWLAEGVPSEVDGDRLDTASSEQAAAAAEFVSCRSDVWPIAVNVLDRTLSVRDVACATDAEMLALTCVIVACKAVGASAAMVSECVRLTPSLRDALNRRSLGGYEAFVLDAVEWRVHPVTTHEVVACKMALLHSTLRDRLAPHVAMTTACCAVLYDLVGLPPSVLADATISAALELMHQPSEVREEVCDTLAVEQTPYLWELQLHILVRAATLLAARAAASEAALEQQLERLRVGADGVDGAREEGAPEEEEEEEEEDERTPVVASTVLPCVANPVALRPALLRGYTRQLERLTALGPPTLPPRNRFVSIPDIALQLGAQTVQRVACSDGECAASWFDAEMWYCGSADRMLADDEGFAALTPTTRSSSSSSSSSKDSSRKDSSTSSNGSNGSAGSGSRRRRRGSGGSSARASASAGTEEGVPSEGSPAARADAAKVKAKAPLRGRRERRRRARRSAAKATLQRHANAMSTAEWDAEILGVGDACRALRLGKGGGAGRHESRPQQLKLRIVRTYAECRRVRRRGERTGALLGKRLRSAAAATQEVAAHAAATKRSPPPPQAAPPARLRSRGGGRKPAAVKADATPPAKRLRSALDRCDVGLPCARTVMIRRLVKKAADLASELDVENRSNRFDEIDDDDANAEVSVTFPSSWATQKSYAVAQWLRRHSVADFRTELNGKGSLWPRTGELRVFAPMQTVHVIEKALQRRVATVAS